MSEDSSRGHVTLFKGAADNPYFEVYFQAQPAAGAESVEVETVALDLRPERDMTLHVEVYNPSGTIPLVVTPGGMGECDGFRGFARNVAAADPEIRVVIWDRRNMGRSEVNWGTDPLAIEEAEDLHVMVDKLGLGRPTFYGMSAGSRSNMVVAERYPEQVAALVIAPLTGGPIAAQQLPEEYYLKYLSDESLTSMEAVAETPLWAAYMARNSDERRQHLLQQDVGEFLDAMRRSGEHLQSYVWQTTLGMTDEQLESLDVPATLILHHGDETDGLHPIPHSRAATTLLGNCDFVIAPTLETIVDSLLPFVRQHTSPLA